MDETKGAQQSRVSQRVTIVALVVVVFTPLLAWFADTVFWCGFEGITIGAAIERHYWLALALAAAVWLWQQYDDRPRDFGPAVLRTSLFVGLAGTAGVYWWASSHTSTVLTCAVRAAERSSDLETLLRLGAAYVAAADDPANLALRGSPADKLGTLYVGRSDLREGAFEAYLTAAERYRDDWRAPNELAGLYSGDGDCDAALQAARLAKARAERLAEPERRRALRRVGDPEASDKICRMLP